MIGSTVVHGFPFAAIVVAVVLLALNGFFVAAEFSLLASLRARIEPLADERRSARVALSSMGRLGAMLAGTQLGVTVCSIVLGSVSEPAVDGLLREIGGWTHVPRAVAGILAVVLSLSFVAFLHLLFGEMVPKSIALSGPERVLLVVAMPIAAFVWVLRPIIWGLNLLARLGARAFGVTSSDELRATATSAELSVMLEESVGEGLIADQEADLLVRSLSFVQRTAADVMVPRDEIVAVDADATVADIEEVVRSSGHTRLLVAKDASRGDLDAVSGFVHAKDLLRLPASMANEPLPFRPRLVVAVPPERTLADLLVIMRARRVHVAIVVDEFQHTLGMATLENVLESIVGDIVDETDREAASGRS
jgi:CBS domain containing-hemolysin-like protein